MTAEPAAVDDDPAPLQPILVVLVWRGGERFARCLDSIGPAIHRFSRVILSVTAAADSDDMIRATSFRDQYPHVEVVCTLRELPTMQHQAFWINYLERSGAQKTDWIYWLAYDDQIRLAGIDNLVDEQGNWPLTPGTAYLGPWAMRHEQPDTLFDGPWDLDMESWTAFPVDGPCELPVTKWIGQQLLQPTYIQMSGSVITFASHRHVVRSHPHKKGPMRIEMATAAARNNLTVAEFPEPISIIYGRSNSDRASYGKSARSEDIHLIAWLTRYAARHRKAWRDLFSTTRRGLRIYVDARRGRCPLPTEEWRVRGWVPQDSPRLTLDPEVTI